MAIAVFLSLPGYSYAVVSMVTDASYQSNEVTVGSISSSSTQERLGIMMNYNGAPSPKLTFTGILRLDVLKRKRDPGSVSTELQPNLSIKMATKAVQLNTGYRQVLRDETIITGSTTSNLTSRSSDAVADAAIRAGKLPDFRIRYGLRDQRQEADGIASNDTKTQDMQGSLNYRLKAFSFNADYSIQNVTNQLTGAKSDIKQGSGQFRFTRKLGAKANFSLREDYRFADSTDLSGAKTKRSSSISEGRLDTTPVERSKVSLNYLYRVEKGALTTTENNMFVTGDYALPRFLRFYGNYTDRALDSSDRNTSSKITVAGVNFKHRAGRFDITSRYERRVDKTTTESAGVTSSTDNTRDNFDWLIGTRLASYLDLALSESYVVSSFMGKTSKNDLYRFKVHFGPVKNFELTPYMDYQTLESTGAPGTTTTEIVVPARYRIDLHKKLNLTFVDNYRRRTSSTEGSADNTVVANNLVARAEMPMFLKGMTASADASFNNTKTNLSSVSTNSYALRMTWSRNPHSVNTNIMYQTGSSIPPTTSMALQYRLSLRMKKIMMGLQASYSYTMTEARAAAGRSTGQSIFITLNLKK